MDKDGEGGEEPRTGNDPDAEARADETAGVMGIGPRAGNRAGALAFLALAVLIAAALHFHFSAEGGDAFLARLDSDLLTNAELSLVSTGDGNRLTVVPSWPLRLYSSLRRDIVLYAAAAALAGYLWGLSAKARARRDAYLIHQKLSAEVADLRARVDGLENRPGREADRTPGGTKGT